MRASIVVNSTKEPGDYDLIVTYMGPNGYQRGWTMRVPRGDVRRAEHSARLAAMKMAAAVDWRPPTHGRIEARPS